MMVIENTNQDIQYSQEDIMFGPILRKNKDELFIVIGKNNIKHI